MHSTNNGFSDFRGAIDRLPVRNLERSDLMTNDFLLDEDGRVSLYWAPFDAINARARVAIVGLTPGWTQMRAAFEAARNAIRGGADDGGARCVLLAMQNGRLAT